MTGTRLLLASDFDGTLAPIRRDPEKVEIDASARSFFLWASRQEGVEVAFISGRDLEDLRSRTSGVNAWRSGSHGQEIETAKGELIRSARERSSSPPAEWDKRAREMGLRIEEKKFGVAVHWRDVEGVDETHPLIGEFENWADAENLEITHGRCVIEAAVAGASKKTVLEVLVSETGAQRVIYAGDDITDLPAIELAAAKGRGFFVRSSEREAELTGSVEMVESIEELLTRMKEEVVALEDRA